MPVTANEWPILSQFLCVVESTTGMPAESAAPPPSKTSDDERAIFKDNRPPKKLSKGVVLGKDGKPCRSCTDTKSWLQMVKTQNPMSQGITASSTPTLELSSSTLPPDCPVDVEELGRSTWTMLHTMTANYPPSPPPVLQQQAKSFLQLFSNMYPCSHCAEDFRDWMKEEGNTPKLSTRDEFGRWMCAAHNAVNVKLGKERFDCNKWEERWRTGPSDGRCG